MRNGRKIKVYHTNYNGGRNQVFSRDEWCEIVTDKNGNSVEEFFFPFISGLSAPSPDDERDLWEKVLRLFKQDSATATAPETDSASLSQSEPIKEERHESVG